jgi:hypothetical protein
MNNVAIIVIKGQEMNMAIKEERVSNEFSLITYAIFNDGRIRD